jgi:succinate dehydrogenase cytochrome b subunit
MAQSRAPAPRPLSPHLQIYRWTWTMTMSIFHRLTGIGLYLGISLLAIWLVALASGPGAFGAVQGFFGSWFGMLVLFGYTFVLMHHLIGGVRHLVWDFGHGMEPGTRFAMARYTLFASIPLTILIWIVGLMMR